MCCSFGDPCRRQHRGEDGRWVASLCNPQGAGARWRGCISHSLAFSGAGSAGVCSQPGLREVSVIGYAATRPAHSCDGAVHARANRWPAGSPACRHIAKEGGSLFDVAIPRSCCLMGSHPAHQVSLICLIRYLHGPTPAITHTGDLKMILRISFLFEVACGLHAPCK